MLWMERAKSWAREVKRDVVALYLAAQDPRTPLIAKIAAASVAAYALSPIDHPRLRPGAGLSTSSNEIFDPRIVNPTPIVLASMERCVAELHPLFWDNRSEAIMLSKLSTLRGPMPSEPNR